MDVVNFDVFCLHFLKKAPTGATVVECLLRQAAGEPRTIFIGRIGRVGACMVGRLYCYRVYYTFYTVFEFVVIGDITETRWLAFYDTNVYIKLVFIYINTCITMHKKFYVKT